MQFATIRGLSKISRALTALCLLLILTSCHNLAVMIGSAGSAKYTSGIESLALDPNGRFVLTWTPSTDVKASKISYRIWLQTSATAPLTLQDESSQLLTTLILEDEKPGTNLIAEQPIATVSDVNSWTYDGVIDPDLYYTFKVKPVEAKVQFKAKVVVGKINFPEIVTQDVVREGTKQYRVKLNPFDGVTYQLHRKDLPIASSLVSEFVLSESEARNNELYCVRLVIGTLVSPECYPLDRVGSNWRPFATKVERVDTSSRYKIGDTLQLKVTFSEAIEATSSGSRLGLPLELGRTQLASDLSGQGSDVWIFEYEIEEGDYASLLKPGRLFQLSDEATFQNKDGQRLELSLPAFEFADVLIDGIKPTAPASVGFALAASPETSVLVSFVKGTDTHLEAHSAKLCENSDCESACLTEGRSTDASLTLIGEANKSYFACVKSHDIAGNTSDWVSSVQSILIDTIPPTVDAGIDLLARQTVSTAASSNGASIHAWSKVSGPGDVAFSSASSLNTNLSATADGVYVLRLTTYDAAGNSASDEMNFTWDTTPPLVDIGGDQFIRQLSPLDASTTDAVSWSWTQVAGPGVLSFATPTAEDSNVSADQEGLYELRLTVSDLAGNTAYDQINLTWDVTPPTVDAGPDRISATSITLQADSADGNQWLWSEVSGPGTLSFTDATLEDPGLSADQDGTYVASLTVTDQAGNSASDSMTFIRDTTAPTFAGLDSINYLDGLTNLHLDWTAAVDANTPKWEMVYEICQTTTPGDCASNFTATYTTDPGEVSYLVTGINPALDYEFVVRTKDNLGNANVNTRTRGKAIENVSKIATGLRFSCALHTNQTVSCWGNGTLGRLGNGSDSSTSLPILVSGINNATSIVVGSAWACALLSDGTVKCWGNNMYGQLGDGTYVNSNVPVLVSGVTNAVQITAGRNSACARMSDFTAKCWGHNSSGQLGTGIVSNDSPPALVTVVSDIYDITMGETFACALVTNLRAPKCWGSNASGQLGNGTLVDSPTAAVDVTGMTGATSLHAGTIQVCGIINTGLRCWGSNGWGRLGDGTNVDRSSPSTVYADGSNVAGVSLSNSATCSHLSDGTARCWGNSDGYQVGNGENGQYWEPRALLGDPLVSTISMGWYHACAVIAGTGGRARCWGISYDGETSTTNSLNVFQPISVDNTDVFTKVDTGGYHSCGLLSDQTVKCWGANTWGQVADGTQKNVFKPKQIPGITTAIDIASSEQGACAVLADGSIRCWGENPKFQVGDGTQINRYAPVSVQNIANAVKIEAGKSFYCALLSDATVKCWGENTEGTLGDGTNVDNGNPVTVSGLTQVTQLSVGYDHSCAKVAAGDFYCWGSGDFGELGQGLAQSSNVPVAVTVTTGIKRIEAAWDFTCVILNDDTAQCWGYGTGGELGNGLNNHSITAVSVLNLTGIQTLDTFSDHVCARMSSDNVQCWGGNTYGQIGLGAGSPGVVNTPTRLSLAGVSSISPGYLHTCAVKTNGSLRCWGYNFFGQVGIPPGDYPTWVNGL